MSIEQKIAELLAESKAAEQVVEEEVVEEEIVSEEADELDEEQLDELSKDTLKSYVGKAEDDKHDLKTWGAATDTGSAKDDRKLTNRLIKNRTAGIKTATKKLAKEEFSIDMSEDVAALTNGEELSEEFKTKAATIFEAAVVNRVKQEIASLEEEFDLQLEEAVNQSQEALVEKVDGYLNYVVETWINDNEIALERGMKSEILESFVAGMKGLFEEHYIDVPEEKFDLIGEMEETIEVLNGKLDEQVAANVEMKKNLDEAAKLDIIKSLSEGLADTEKEKFTSLVEELVFESAEVFETKVQTIRENYFTNKAPTKTVIGSVVTDEVVSLTEEKVVPVGMRKYVDALNTLK